MRVVLLFVILVCFMDGRVSICLLSTLVLMDFVRYNLYAAEYEQCLLQPKYLSLEMSFAFEF